MSADTPESVAARLRAYGDSHLKGCPPIIITAADVIEAQTQKIERLSAFRDAVSNLASRLESHNLFDRVASDQWALVHVWDAVVNAKYRTDARATRADAEVSRLSASHKAELIEIGDAADADLRHHNDALLHYSAVASVKRLHDERNGLLGDIDHAWEAFGTAGNRGALTLAEQIGSLDRELDAALDRATSAEAALAASEERERGLREALDAVLNGTANTYAGCADSGGDSWSCTLCGEEWETKRHDPDAHHQRCAIRKVYAALSTGDALPTAPTTEQKDT